jgi:hypothetical protein
MPRGGPSASRTVWTSCTRSGMWSATRLLGRPKGHDCLVAPLPNGPRSNGSRRR